METSGSKTTRARLLEAAVEEYAEEGFRNARVRAICSRAGANSAAVNYHFGNKRRLYEEVLHHAFLTLSGFDPLAWDAGPTATPKHRLRAFIHSLLTQLLSDGRSALYVKLVTKELSDPTAALQRVIDDGIRPQVETLQAITRELLGPGATEDHVRRCAASILGQCLYYHFARPVIAHLGHEKKLDASVVETLADHVTRFSLRGLGHHQEDETSRKRSGD